MLDCKALTLVNILNKQILHKYHVILYWPIINWLRKISYEIRTIYQPQEYDVIVFTSHMCSKYVHKSNKNIVDEFSLYIIVLFLFILFIGKLSMLNLIENG